jgi:FlaA1/EpsC-like NDP-sugar epimerase
LIRHDVLRKALTFGADSLSIVAGSILCTLIYRPEASVSFTGIQAFIPMVLITMALVSSVMKTYKNPVSQNILNSMLLSIGTFVMSLAVSAVFKMLIDGRQLNLGFLFNLLVYTVFFLGSYRLAPCIMLGISGAVGNGRRQASTRKPSVGDIKDISVEELLGRKTVMPDLQNVGSYLADSTVLVAGGAGAVGFELCSQILQCNAKLVVILDVNENKLSETEIELSLKYPKTRFVMCVGSIQDRARLREIFDLYRPQVVFHAASYKNAQMMEKNPQEALKNNVMGTLYMVEMAIKHRTDRFIMLSADIAVHPTHIIGASKRVAEMLVQRANEWGETRFSAVRFGTAVGNGGCIVQLFKKQIQAGGPVYISDKNIERYLMTLPEAAQLVIAAGGLSKGGEVFALDMGEPVNLYNLAKSMILRYGLKPDRDIEIVITGLRTAEKNGNENRPKNEFTGKTANERISVLQENENPPVTFEEEFDKLCQSIDDRDYGLALGKVSVLVPSFQNLKT